LAEAVLDAGYAKHGKDFVLIEGMYFSHAEILKWREDACAEPEVEEPITIEAVGVTREGEDGIYIEWTLEGGIAALEVAGLVLFACPEANDMCAEDGSAEIYLQPVDLDATEQRGYLRGLSEANTGECDVPPPGWTCSRAKGHDGPCAASQAVPVEPVPLRVELDAYVAGLQAERKRLLMLLKKIDQTPLDRWYHEHLNSDVGEAVRFLERSPQQLTYFSSQSTNCAGCGKHKHTPLRVDPMGGYVCLTCIDQELERLLIEESARHAEPDWEGAQEISDLPHVHDMLQDFSADPTEDNAISVVQAIVMATTRKQEE
jgi:hypothetical protein